MSFALGEFSLSLTVKDLAASQSFYTTLGFSVVKGCADTEDPSYGVDWVMLERDGLKLGLFHGMFDKNTITFNPPDVRAVQQALKADGIGFALEVDESEGGPAAALVYDPDGNPILFDQHD